MIISGGENVYPAEIEGVLATHPGIREAAVIGQESERWGESPLAIVVRSDDNLGAPEVLEFCQGRLARFKQPQVIELRNTAQPQRQNSQAGASGAIRS